MAGRAVVVVSLVAVLFSVPAFTRQLTPGVTSAAGAVEQAASLRDAGRLPAAVEVLRAHLARYPDDGDAARLLAQTLYWLKDLSGARAVYEDALVRHPEDTTLRLQYGRMLVETGRRDRAREILTPLRSLPATEADADALLGTLAYWEGDLSTARHMFQAALRANPNQRDATRQLLEIATLTSPSIRVSSGLRHDDQPLDHVEGAIEARWFATPLAPVTVRLTPAGYWPSGGSSQSVWAADASIANYAPAARIETEFGAGLLHRSWGTDGMDWQGRARVAVRLAPGFSLGVRAQRAAYFYTASSLETPVTTDAAGVIVHLDNRHGWLGEAAYEWQRYPDANSVTTAYCWLLAPIVHRDGNAFQVGYAYAHADSDQSRFVLANPAQPHPPTDPRFDFTGIYDPYYTPLDQVSHSAIAALALRASSAAMFRLSGSGALHATEQQPGFSVSGTQAVSTTSRRTFAPWNARTSLEVAIGRALTLGVNAEVGRTAYYTWATAGVTLTHRFGGIE